MTVTPRAVTRQELWAALRSGEYDLAGVALDALGNDAECFLMAWTSDSQDNVASYENSAYDTLMSIIAHAGDGLDAAGDSHRGLPGCPGLVQLLRCDPQKRIAFYLKIYLTPGRGDGIRLPFGSIVQENSPFQAKKWNHA